MSRLKGGTVADRTTETWSGRPAFILASIGAAVGLGNIWKFPYTLGNSGGSAFVLIYVLAMLLIATPIMLSEMIIGRHARMSAPSALRTVAVENGSSPWWQAVGWMGQLVQLLVLSFYSVIAGWALAYVFRAGSGLFTGLTADGVQSIFSNLVDEPERLLAWHTIFIVMTMIIVGICMLEEIRMMKFTSGAYEQYRAKAPFLMPLPRWFNRIISWPARMITGGGYPARRIQVFWIILLYTGIFMALSLFWVDIGSSRTISSSENEQQEQLAVIVEGLDRMGDDRRAIYARMEKIPCYGAAGTVVLLNLSAHPNPIIRLFSIQFLGAQ